MFGICGDVSDFLYMQSLYPIPIHLQKKQHNQFAMQIFD